MSAEGLQAEWQDGRVRFLEQMFKERMVSTPYFRGTAKFHVTAEERQRHPNS